MIIKQKLDVKSAANPLNSKLDVISKAISTRSVITFVDAENHKCVAEPFVLGVQKDTGKHVLRCYKNFPLEPWDKKENWQVFEVEAIKEVRITPARTKQSRGNYEPRSPAMSQILYAVSGYK
ncbi:MAG TPA: hypothetical protein VG603_05205 [Chitinophagales bacterium]|nr:hypothetical protein [Chitinophagales bacterium]